MTTIKFLLIKKKFIPALVIAPLEDVSISAQMRKSLILISGVLSFLVSENEILVPLTLAIAKYIGSHFAYTRALAQFFTLRHKQIIQGKDKDLAQLLFYYEVDPISSKLYGKIDEEIQQYIKVVTSDGIKMIVSSSLNEYGEIVSEYFVDHMITVVGALLHEEKMAGSDLIKEDFWKR